jgi:hypothetical protein
LNVLVQAATMAATPSAHDLPCQTCTAHGPGVSFLAVAFLVAVILAYVMGWIAGREGLRKQFQKFFGNQPKGHH